MRISLLLPDSIILSSTGGIALCSRDRGGRRTDGPAVNPVTTDIDTPGRAGRLVSHEVGHGKFQGTFAFPA
ncbi:hypothetical protein HDK64DRAFT_264610 [Phyllosticta capitalensis]